MAKSYVLKNIKIPKNTTFDKLSKINLLNNKIGKDAFDKVKKDKTIAQPKKINQAQKIKLKKFK